MSEGTFPNDILKDGTLSPSTRKEQVNEPETKRDKEEEEKSNSFLDDDASDDSSSSYCTALCSLSEYSEALEDEAQVFGTGPHHHSVASESTDTMSAVRRTTKGSFEDTVVMHEPRTKDDEDSQDTVSKELLCGHDKVSSLVTSPVFLGPSNSTNSAGAQCDGADKRISSMKDSFMKTLDYSRNNKNTAQNEIKTVERTDSLKARFTLALNEEPQCEPCKAISTGSGSHLLKYLSSPEKEIQNLNIEKVDSVDTESDKPQPSNRGSLLKSSDYFRVNKKIAQKDNKLAEKLNCLETRFSSNTLWITSERNQCSQERGQENSSNKPREHPTIHQQISREDLNKQSVEFKPDRGGSNIGHMKWDGEEEGKGVGKEQAELPLKAKNRQPTASCTSTLTPSKQKSGIPPRCYSERFLATRHQHHPRSPPLFSLLPPAPCSSYRRPCSTADNSKKAFGMATKLAEATTAVKGLTNPDNVRPSCPEANYLEVSNSSCWSSSQMSSDGGFHDWSQDVLSLSLPMASTNEHNTSACSEASSFECIDVALENLEEVNRNAKTVPKRQIQLKRRDTAEAQISENSSNNAIAQVSSTPSRPRDVLQRQHSTPAAFHQNSHGSEPKSIQTERKQRLQKSLSLDETSSKTKMASCIIKNVLTKRMQHEQNLRDLDVSEHVFAPIRALSTTNNNNHLTSSAMDVSTKNTKVNMATGPPLSGGTSSETPAHTTEPHAKTSSTKDLTCISSKHKFNPQSSTMTEFQGGGTEITVSPEAEKDKLSPSKELTRQSPGAKLSCDSAKGKAWNSSAVISRAIDKQATLKPTPEECCAMQAVHKQHNVKNHPATGMEKQEKGEATESTPSPTMAACLAYDLDARTADNTLSQCVPGKEQGSDRGDLKPPGHSVNMGIQSQGKFKAIAPVHVVRDMRSLVKNTYSLSFRGPGEAAQGQEDTGSGLQPATAHQVSSKGEDKGKGYKQDEKPHVRKVTPPLAKDRIRDLASLHATPRGCATKSSSFLESHDKTPNAGFAKVSPISTVKVNSCTMSKSPEVQDIQTAVKQIDVQGSNANTKQTNQAGMLREASKDPSTGMAKNGQTTDTSKRGYEKRRNSAENQWKQPTAALQYCPPTASSDQQDSCKESDQVCSMVRDGHQTPGPPPRSQSSTGPSSTCILTVGPTPVLPPYFYQAVSPHMGTVGYVQGPVLLQTPAHSQPATANGPVNLIRPMSADGQLLSQPSSTAGYTPKHNSSKQMENRETRLKMPSPDTQQYTTFVANLGPEVIQGTAGVLLPEVGGALAQSPRHMLLDPETGRCFYVEMPQLPQRKMLFDPQTCQYVEVLLPQQTVPSTVLPSHCAIPFPSFHIPAMYTPQCLPYIQAHPQVMPPPEP